VTELRAKLSLAPVSLISVVTSTAFTLCADLSLRRPFDVGLSRTLTVPALVAVAVPRANSIAGGAFLWCLCPLLAAYAGSMPP
jgi:hypothetical protein